MSARTETPNDVAGLAMELPIQIQTAILSERYGCAVCATISWDDTGDPEFDLGHPLHGWPELTRLMAVNADFQAFSAFTDLNVKSSLYYQSELVYLRKKLHQME
jgi:hypothetical protein